MKKLTVLALIAALFGCKKDVSNTPATLTTVEYSFDSDSNSGLMFRDGEPVEKMTSESRRYEIGKVLRVKPVDSVTIEVANFAPVDILDATILLTIEGQAKPIQLFKIKKIRAHGVKEIKYPFIGGNTKFLDTDKKEVDLSQYKISGIATNKVAFDFTGETDLIKKLKTLAKLKWTIKYHDYDPNHDPRNNWKDTVNAKDFRRFSGFIINLAYLLQSDTTRTAFLNEPITDNNQVLMTTEQKATAFQQLRDIPQFNCGVVVNVSGLGGGSTFGMADYILNGYLTRDYCFEAIHEMGHMIGYSHSSTMTYPSNPGNRGAVVATGNVYKQMLAKDEFPIKKSNYYMAADL